MDTIISQAVEKKSTETPEEAITEIPQNNEAAEFDLDLDLATEQETEQTAEESIELQSPGEEAGLDFDFKMDDEPQLVEEPEEQTQVMPELDLSGINLDLDESPTIAANEEIADTGGDQWHEVATKLDLAKAYVEMGDKEGAREILQEVVQEGDAQQQGDAKALLADLV